MIEPEKQEERKEEKALTPEQIAVIIKERARALLDEPTDIKKIIEVISAAKDCGKASGYTEEELEAAEKAFSQKKENQETSYQNREKAQRKKQNNRKIVITISSLAITIAFILLGLAMPSKKTVKEKQVVQTSVIQSNQESCLEPEQAKYHGATATLTSVAENYEKAATQAENCANNEKDREMQAEYLLTAASDTKQEADIEENFDKDKARSTRARARYLAQSVRNISKERQTHNEAEEIIKQIDLQ